MAKRLPIDLLEQVQTALRDHPAGLALRELEARLTGVASRRSLQRKLNGWQRKGLVRAVGIRRGPRYLLAPPTGPTPPPAPLPRRLSPPPQPHSVRPTTMAFLFQRRAVNYERW